MYRILGLAPTVRTISSFTEFRQAEWDVLVTDRPLTTTLGPGVTLSPASHLCVVYVVSTGLRALTIEARQNWSTNVGASWDHPCRELMRFSGLPERIAALTHEQLEPVLRTRETHQFFHVGGGLPKSSGALPGQGTSYSGGPAQPKYHPELEPFIATADGNVLAGRYRRSKASEAWLLPADVPDLVPWIRAALAEWHTLAPDRFPGVPDWSQTEPWMTRAERSLTERLRELAHEREDVLNQLAQREATLQSDLATATSAADQYERALLTTQSNDLVGAVKRTLEEFGFEVVDADAAAEPDDHLEDLQITDPGAPGWIALGEVKGYTKGAKTEALIQLLRFKARYVERNGTSPDASWYIVNQFLARDPSTRQVALHGKDGDIAAFAAAGGLVVDTVVLFKLLSQVRDGEITAEEARKHLRTSTGRLALPTK